MTSKVDHDAYDEYTSWSCGCCESITSTLLRRGKLGYTPERFNVKCPVCRRAQVTMILKQV